MSICEVFRDIIGLIFILVLEINPVNKIAVFQLLSNNSAKQLQKINIFFYDFVIKGNTLVKKPFIKKSFDNLLTIMYK